MSSPPDSAPLEAELKYWAFISYSHHDRHWAEWLHRSLERYRIPRRLVGRATPAGVAPARLFPVFRDREEMAASADLGGSLREVLRQSRNVIVICSPHSAQSRWVNEEIRAFKAMGRAQRVQSLIVAGEHFAGNEIRPDECFPPALRFQVAPDGQLSGEPAEPVAADVRPGKDGKHHAKLKLISSLLGLGFDELRQRDVLRRRQRAAGLALLAAALAVAAFGLWQIQAQRGRHRLLAQQRLTTAQEAEERGRVALLGGSADLSVREFTTALDAVSNRPAARLMLGVAQRSAGTAVSVLEQEQDVFKILLSGDGFHLLTVGTQKSASLWDLSTRRLLREVGELDNVNALFNRRGDRVLLAHHGAWAIQEVASGKEISLPGGPATEATFLGEGDEVLWCHNEYKTSATRFVIYRTADGHPLREFSMSDGNAGGLSSDPAGQTVLMAWFAPGQTRLKWVEVATGTVLADLPRHGFGKLELSPDGERLLYLRPDHTVEVRSKTAVLWSTPRTKDDEPAVHWSRGGGLVLLTSLGVTYALNPADGTLKWKDYSGPLATDSSDSFAAAADHEGSVRVRNLQSGEVLNEFTDRIGWPETAAYSHDGEVAFSPEGKELLLAGSGRKIKIWNWRKANGESVSIGKTGASVAAATFSPDGTLIALPTADRGAAVWDIATRRRRLEIEQPHQSSGLLTMAFSPDSRRLLASSSILKPHVTAGLWETANGQPVGALDDSARIPANGVSGETELRVGWGAGCLVTANFVRGAAGLWDAASLRKLMELPLGPPTSELVPTLEGARRLSFSKDGRRVAAAGFDGSVRIYALPAGKQLAILPHPFPKLSCVELSADGSTALTTDLDGHAVAWQIDSGRQWRDFAPESAKINEIHLSPDGRLAAAACSDKIVRVWDVRTGAVTTLREQAPANDGSPTLGALLLSPWERRGFLSAQFDPAGGWLAAINDDGRLCVWEMAAGRQLLRWKLSHITREAALAVAPDGHRLAVFGLGGPARLFDLTPAEVSRSQAAGKR